MDRRSYENVLSDLELENKVKRGEVEKLNQEISQNENIISILQIKLLQDDIPPAEQINNSKPIESADNNFTSALVSEYTEKNQSKVSLCNACEKILQSEEKSLYVTDLIEKIKDYGRFTNRKQLVGTIRKDKRFINLGGNIWDLRQRHPEKSEN